MGAAMLAAVGCGAFSSVKEAADKIVGTVGSVKPDPVFSKNYDRKYKVFRTLYPVAKAVFSEI